MPKSTPTWIVEEVYEGDAGTFVKLAQTQYEPTEESPKVGQVLTLKAKDA